MERLVAFIDPQNTASIRVAEKIGMRFERKVEFKSFGEVDLYTADKPVMEVMIGMNR